ncbi:dTDP-4-dehydrorhamnose reductase [Blastomonas sp. RAC04]|uniref:dTDP-4-dehydrorhamnose reductase n=1 Tax=Blastomonas sp. RAC04 TaxID=1842535 RepID=UPI00083E3337|nr:dTDP-4-dehydrorhamnose reductase [Blastomonas sp. RAC04]AOF99962.1 dTDP-4-dehydrorhamnose reductase [Blastomonas sp. RAC04]
MKALVLGSKGQLGRQLVACAPAGSIVVQHDIDTLDICDHHALRTSVESARPDIIFNAAAFTNVDGAEAEEETARKINGEAVGVLAAAARDLGAKLVHVSTDYVFDGLSGRPYAPDAPTHPVSAYGRTKLAGERAAGDAALIVRTAWVYSTTGGNFVRTMLRLFGERSEVRVVSDQMGTPTYAPDLAKALWTLAEKEASGVYHYTDSGAASWYDFAVAIQEEALALQLLDKAIPIVPIPTSGYPTPATRPHYSVLDSTKTMAVLGGPAPHWRANLRLMLRAISSEAR